MMFTPSESWLTLQDLAVLQITCCFLWVQIDMGPTVMNPMQRCLLGSAEDMASP